MAPKIINNHSDDESEERASSSDDDQQQPDPKRSDPHNLSDSDSEDSTPIPEKLQNSESDTGSDSDESDKPLNSPSAADFKIKPISSKPMDSKMPASKSAKRPADKDPNGAVSASNKKSKVDKKKNKSGGGGDAKKSGINRLWSEKDEIVMLKGLIEYKKGKGSDPYSDMSAFHDFIKGMLSVEVTKSQLTEKIRRQKKKFLNNAGKGVNGGDPFFSRPHEHKSFQLSKKIWGGGGEEEASSKKKKDTNFGDSAKKAKVKEIAMKEEVKKEDLLMFPRLREALEAEASMSIIKPKDLKGFVEEMICLLGEDVARKLENMWEECRLMELEVYAKKLELMQKQTGMVVAEMKKLKS